MIKKIMLFFITVFTYYIAGMYQYFPLMVLFIAELFLFIAMLIITKYFKRNLSVEFVNAIQCAEKEIECSCGIQSRNSGKLPISQFKIRLRIQYQQDAKGVVKSIYGGSECGNSTLQFHICAQYCGYIQVEMIQLQVYDYLAIFSSKKKLYHQMMIAVLPEEWALPIEFHPFGISKTDPLQEQRVSYRGEPYLEIRQIREYQENDSNRHIHWNQSAKTDKIWIKEYEKETDTGTEFIINTSGFETADPMVLDGFYELLSAIMLGLLQSLSSIRVCWYVEQQQSLVDMDITSAEQNKELLLQLYQTDFKEQNLRRMEAELQKRITEVSSAFQLDLKLCWYRGEQLIYQFSREKLNQELTQKTFVLS